MMPTAVKRFSLVAMGLMVAFALTSCKKALQGNFIKGIWETKYIYIDTSQADKKFQLVPSCQTSVRTCSYRLDFRDQKLVNAFVFVDDQLVKYAEGNWELLDLETMYLEVDSVFKGEFKLSNGTYKNTYTLESDENIILRLDTAKHYTKIKIERL